MNRFVKPGELKNLPALELTDLLSLPITSFKGFKPQDLEKLNHSFGPFHTIGDLVTNPKLYDLKLPKNWYETLKMIACGLFDHGPTCDWAFDLVTCAPHAAFLARPDAFRTEFGPVYYRGRLDGTARVLVVGQDPSTDEILAQRIFVGRAGQRAQWYLNRVGIRSSYLMFNTYLYSVQNVASSVLDPLITDPKMLAHRNRLFDAAKARNKLEAVICFGSPARKAVDAWPGLGSLKRFNLWHPTAPDEAQVASSWSNEAPKIIAAVKADSGTSPDASAFTTIGHEDIPRPDLPFGLPDFHGRGGGTLSTRDGAKSIKWTIP